MLCPYLKGTFWGASPGGRARSRLLPVQPCPGERLGAPYGVPGAQRGRSCCWGLAPGLFLFISSLGIAGVRPQIPLPRGPRVGVFHPAGRDAVHGQVAHCAPALGERRREKNPTKVPLKLIVFIAGLTVSCKSFYDPAQEHQRGLTWSCSTMGEGAAQPLLSPFPSGLDSHEALGHDAQKRFTVVQTGVK